RSACGAISASAKSRTTARKASCSSATSNCIEVTVRLCPLGAAPRSLRSRPSPPGSLAVARSAGRNGRYRPHRPSLPGAAPRSLRTRPSPPGSLADARSAGRNGRYRPHRPSLPGAAPRSLRSRPSPPGSLAVARSAGRNGRYRPHRPSLPGAAPRSLRSRPSPPGSLAVARSAGRNGRYRPHRPTVFFVFLNALAVVGGRLLTRLVDTTSDLDALDSEGTWAVVLPFEGQPICARFASVRPATPWPGAPWRGVDADAWATSLDRTAFRTRVDRIRSAIGAGRVYQVNLTRRLSAPLPSDADVAALGATLAEGNPSPYAA